MPYLLIFCAFWTFCSFAAYMVIQRHETELVMYFRLQYRMCYEWEDWTRLKRMAIVGGPLTLVVILFLEL